MPHAASLLNNVKKNCPIFIRQTPKPIAPLIGQLLIDRLTPYVRPYSYTGVDYCGPFEVAENLSADAF